MMHWRLIPILASWVLGTGGALAEVPARDAGAPGDLAAAVRLLDEGWTGRAEAILETLAERDPGRAEVWYRLAWARYYARDFEQAEKHVDRALEIEPDNVDLLLLQGHVAGNRARTGGKLKALGRAKKCKGCYERVLELEPDSVEGHLSLIQYLLRAPGVAGGDRDRARELAETLVGIDPVEGRIMKGLVREHADGDREAALVEYRAAYEAAVAGNGDSGRAKSFFVNTLYRLERYDEAEALMREDLDDPYHAVDGRIALARHFQFRGKWDAARAQWEALAAADSTRSRGLQGLASLAEARDDLETAAALYDSAHAADPGRGDMLYQAGRTRLRGGFGLEAAADRFGTYLAGEINRRWPSAGWARVRLAEVLGEAGDEKGAHEQLALLGRQKIHDDRLKKQIEKLQELLEDDWGE